jgi:flagellar biosynthesis protein FlhF
VPRKTFIGSDVPSLMAQAQAELGDDSVVLAVRRLDGGARFELDADDAVSARLEHARRANATRDAAPLAPPPAGRVAATDEARAWPALGRPEETAGPHRVALVGPTGAGKTTTLAKLANHPDAYGGRRVGVLCLDTYRVGAIEQARAYAELSRVPFAVAHEPDDAERALRRLRGCEVVLIDTAGRGPNATRDLDETCALLARLAPHEVHVTLPAGLRAEVMSRVVADWKARGATHVLPTKLDEVPDDTAAFDVAVRHRLRVRWVAVGQEVPADLAPAAMPMMAAARRTRAVETAGVA